MGPMTYTTRTHCPHCADKHYCIPPGNPTTPPGDRLAPFIQAWCVTGPNRSIQASKLYRAYQAWEADQADTPISQRVFGRTIRALGHMASKTSVIYYHGISLNPQAYEYATTHLW